MYPTDSEHSRRQDKMEKSHSTWLCAILSLFSSWKLKPKQKAHLWLLLTMGNSNRAISNLALCANIGNYVLSRLQMNSYWLSTCLFQVLGDVNFRGSFSGKNSQLELTFFPLKFSGEMLRNIFGKWTYFLFFKDQLFSSCNF